MNTPSTQSLRTGFRSSRQCGDVSTPAIRASTRRRRSESSASFSSSAIDLGSGAHDGRLRGARASCDRFHAFPFKSSILRLPPHAPGGAPSQHGPLVQGCRHTCTDRMLDSQRLALRLRTYGFKGFKAPQEDRRALKCSIPRHLWRLKRA